MNPDGWHTNAYTRIKTLVQSQALASTDIDQLLDFVQRLTQNPYRVRADRDQVGEFYCRIGSSATYAGRDLAAGFRIDDTSRTVDVISFAVVPARR